MSGDLESVKEWIVLAIVALGVMMAAVDTTIVILAIPNIMKYYNTDLITTVWTILAYLLVVATLTTPLGRLGDSYGRWKVYNLGFVIFTVASFLCAFSPTIYALIAFRFLQGFGGAMLQANSSAIITETMRKDRLGRAFGITAIGWNVGATLGIVLGGVLTTFFDWQSIFLINVPIGIVASLAGFKYLRTKLVKKVSFDWLGSSVLLVSLALISYGSIDVTGFGLDLQNSLIILIGVLLLFLLFTFIETKVKNPIIDINALKFRQFSLPLLISLFQSVGYLSIIFLIIMYLQGVKGLDPLTASLVLVPGYVLSSGMAVVSGRLIDTFGYRVAVIGGLALQLVSVLLYTQLRINTPIEYIILASILGGIGSALYFPGNNKAVMVNAPPQYLGSAGGLQRTLTNIGTIVSYTLAIVVSSISIPRQYAFEIFVGTTVLNSTLATEFIKGLTVAFVTSGTILMIALILSTLIKSTDRIQSQG